MFHPISMPMERGWVGRVEGDEVVHLAAQTLQHLFTGGGSRRATMPATRSPTSGFSRPSPRRRPIRVFDSDGAFEFANPAAVVGPGSSDQRPEGLCGRARRGARRARRARRREGGLTRRAAARAGARTAEGSRLRDRPRAVVHDDRRGAAGPDRPRGAAPAGPPRRARPDSTGRRLGASRRRTRRSESATSSSRPPRSSSRFRRGPSRSRSRVAGASSSTLEAADDPHVPPPRRPAAVRVRRDPRADARAPAGGRGRRRPRLREPRPALAGGRRREAPGGGREAAQPPLLRRRRGIPKLRAACADLYRRRFGVELDPETEVVATMGAKEGLVHLMWTLVEPGDAALVPAPSYPIHIHAPILAGASVFQVAMAPDEDLVANLADAYARASPRPRVLLLSFPHNPTTATVELDFMEHVGRVRARARDARRPRLRVRRPRLRRARAAFDPPGARARATSRSSSTR